MEGERHEMTYEVTLVREEGRGEVPPCTDTRVPRQALQQSITPLHKCSMGALHKGTIDVTSMCRVASIA